MNLMDYLPSYYWNNNKKNLMPFVQEAVSKELGTLLDDISDTLDQLFVDTATWGLDLWEAELGIATDKTKSDNYRRPVAISKIRGRGITTPGVLAELATLFSGSQAIVIEYPQEYRFVIKFIGARGIPPNLSDLSRAVNEIKPAHLDYSYEYTYLIWYEAATYKWDEAHIMTWDQFRVAKPKYPLDSGGLTTWGEIYTWVRKPTWGSLRLMSWEAFQTYKP